MIREIRKEDAVYEIEAIYYNVTSWKTEDLLEEANELLDASYTLDDIVDVYVKWNRITVTFTDDCQYEEEGGYDHDVDWKEPRQLRLWTENYEEVFSQDEIERQRLNEAAPDLLAALERIVNGLPSEYDDKHTSTLLESAREAIEKAKGESHE